jgi:hypothetical protein
MAHTDLRASAWSGSTYCSITTKLSFQPTIGYQRCALVVEQGTQPEGI